MEQFKDLISQLKTPERIQTYLNDSLIYNFEDTTRSFRGVLESKMADCFEGGVSFAYILLHYHGFNPKIVMIQAENDVDHTLVVYRKKRLWGSIAKSRHKELTGKRAEFSTLRELILSYYPDYTSDYPKYKGQYSMVGFSDPIDLVKKFGTDWFFLPGDFALQHLYDTFTSGVMCTNVFTEERYPYPPEV